MSYERPRYPQFQQRPPPQYVNFGFDWNPQIPPPNLLKQPPPVNYGYNWNPQIPPPNLLKPPPGYDWRPPQIPPPNVFQQQQQQIVDHGYNWQPQLPPPNVLLYIDNSNIFESAKKYSSQKKGYRNGIPDVACRIDIGKLIAKAVGKRGLLFGKLYGSEPPALDSVWDAIRRKQVSVETFQRSKWTLKEKETDSSLTADAVEDIILEKDKAGDNRTVILFSGDRDLLRVVDKAVKFGYKVEIWSFNSSINNTVKRRALDNPTIVSFNKIDDIFNEVTYTKVVWGKKKIPPERSIVASVELSTESDKKTILSTVVAKAGEIFQLPMMGKYMNNYKFIVLVPCIKEHYTPQPCPGKSKSEQLTVRTYSFYKHIQPFYHMLTEAFDFCNEINSWREFVSSRHGSKWFNPVSKTRFELLPADDAESVEEDTVVDVLLSDDESEDFDCNDFFDFHHEDLSDADDDFIPCVRKEAKPRRMYSTYCTFQFWCSKGSDCSYKHTEHQKEFFKVQTDAKKRKLYKIKPCYHTPCQYALKPYLCAYAHSLKESRCLCCKERGSGEHWMDQCPVNRKLIN